jgi:murein L,D-transpeptidase YcbB/YkuD
MRKSRLFAIAVFAASLAGAAVAQEQQQTSQDLSRLHDALNLSPQQQGAWRAYIAAINPDPQLEARHRSAAQMMQSLPTPRRIDLIEAEMEADMTAMRRQGQAVKAFYAQLSPAQQRTFDVLTYQAEVQRNEPER